MESTSTESSPASQPGSSRAFRLLRPGRISALLALSALLAVGLANPAAAEPRNASTEPASFSFDLTLATGAAGCLQNARGSVKITPHGPVQQMDVNVSGLPANNTFTVFVLQLPHSPFGLSWYQGDVVTDVNGEGHGRFVGIFSNETFVVAPNVGAAPSEHPADAVTNPQTAPVHTLHLGMWFDSTAEAQAAKCSANPTPFNGDHTAGIQVLNTTNFPDLAGPLGQFGN